MPTIKEELDQLKNQKGFVQYRGLPSKRKTEDSLMTDSGSCNVFYLQVHDLDFKDNCERMPKTMQLIRDIVPRSYGVCYLEAFTPGTHLIAHNGPTNKKLRLNLPLVGAEGASMRVGDETRNLEQGKCLIYDDSFNHEAWHNGSAVRISLIVDFWHPNDQIIMDAEAQQNNQKLKPNEQHNNNNIEKDGAVNKLGGEEAHAPSTNTH